MMDVCDLFDEVTLVISSQGGTSRVMMTQWRKGLARCSSVSTYSSDLKPIIPGCSSKVFEFPLYGCMAPPDSTSDAGAPLLCLLKCLTHKDVVFRGIPDIGAKYRSIMDASDEFRSSNSKHTEDFVVITWTIWDSQNEFNFRNSSLPSNMVSKKALAFVHEYKEIRAPFSLETNNPELVKKKGGIWVEHMGQPIIAQVSLAKNNPLTDRGL
ncbi:hypothetical protein Cgig2_031112 [Carnegiea gigantea]|uniref:Uncharacterized protein n=1 Tax=Carnegiea gigantea TaxID=171969 RepID=A0A9Q1JUC7_9CARY|nr:hypothetical protein Cgig2_031112 [Carnegiea gigantea]